jgi:predicted nucleic acid-binding Zn ribbon protein
MRVKPKKGSARQIERERFGTDLPPPPPFVGERPGDWIANVMKSAGMEDKVWEQTLQAEWADVVGREGAAHTRPGSYSRGALIIYVDSSPWMAALQMEFKDMIYKNLSEKFGEGRIQRIGFAIDPGDGAKS